MVELGDAEAVEQMHPPGPRGGHADPTRLVNLVERTASKHAHFLVPGLHTLRAVGGALESRNALPCSAVDSAPGNG